MKSKSKVFISYRREGGADLARLVRDSLQQRGYDVFMDVENLRSGPFNTALFKEIESATDVVVILTPGSLDRCRNQGDWVRLEIAHAIKQKKNIVPVMARGFEWPPATKPLPDDVAALPMFNGVPPSHEYFDASLDKLATLLIGQPRRSRTQFYVIAAVLVCSVFLGVVVSFSPSFRRTATSVTAIDSPKIGATYQALANDLAQYMADPSSIPITVGNFLYEDTELMSPFSSELRQEMERALADTGKFKIVTRDRLDDLQTELMLQGAFPSSPGGKPFTGATPNPAPKSAASAVQAIVRGRFYYKAPDLTVYAELVSLADSTVHKSKIVLSAQSISAKVMPTSLAAQPTNAQPREQLDGYLQPQSLAQSQINLADVQRRITSITNDFKIQLIVKEAKNDFAEGEKISYRLWSDTDCHIAVFCHQVDGSSVVLFPNAYNHDTWLTADTRLDIPGLNKRGFQIVIGPPFGADAVQVIGCTKASALHRMVGDLMAKPSSNTPGYRGIDRGMFVQGLTDSLAEQKQDPAGPARWAEAHIVVSTYPKPK